jgi:hypothetical protein
MPSKWSSLGRRKELEFRQWNLILNKQTQL